MRRTQLFVLALVLFAGGCTKIDPPTLASEMPVFNAEHSTVGTTENSVRVSHPSPGNGRDTVDFTTRSGFLGGGH